MRIDLNCPACGDNRLSLEDAQTDDCMVHCMDCGHPIGTFKELTERVAETVITRTRLKDQT